MRRISCLLLYASLACAADTPSFWNVQLTSDVSLRYMVNGQISTDATAQYFSFALTTSTPLLTVAASGCSTCGNVTAFNQQGSTTVQPLSNSDNVNLIGGVSTSGPLVRESCAFRAENGSWSLPNQAILTSDQSSRVYSGRVSGLFGLASGRSTNNLNVSIIGGIFDHQPTLESATFGLALRPPSPKGSDDAGSLHWLGVDPGAYDGDITWKDTTTSPNSDVTTFKFDGWQFLMGGAVLVDRSQELTAVVDPYYVNVFFPSREAQLIHASIKGSSSQTANDGQSTVYVVPCNTKFALSTVIGGQVWRVDQALLVRKMGDGTCVSNIQGWADTNNNLYLFGSAFLSSLYLIVRVGNHNYNQTDYIGFARRTNPPSIVGPVVGGVVGSFGGIALITLTIFFWIRCRDQQKIRDVLDSQDQSGDFGRFTENKDAKPFPLTVQPTKAPPISPTSLSHTATSQPPVVDGIP